jgi:hypothetical protein
LKGERGSESGGKKEGGKKKNRNIVKGEGEKSRDSGTDRERD